MSKYRVHVHDHADQGRWLAQQDFAKRPTQEQVTAAFPVLATPGRYEVRLGLLSGEDEINAGGWLQGEPAPVPGDGHPFTDDGTDPGNCSVCHFYHRDPAMTADQFAAVVLEQTQKRLAATYPTSPQWSWERVQVIPGPKYTKVDVGPEHNMSGKYMIDNATGEIFGIKGYGRVHKGHTYGTLATVDDWYWGGYTGQPRSDFRPVDPELFARTAPRWNCVSYPLDGPHYTPGTGNCAWCGKSREKMAAEFQAAQRCCENCQG